MSSTVSGNVFGNHNASLVLGGFRGADNVAAAASGMLSSPPPATTVAISATGLLIASTQSTGSALTVREFLAQRRGIEDGTAVISDTSANLSRYFNSLRTYEAKIATIEVSDSDTASLRLSAAQFDSIDGSAVLDKVDEYSVSLTGVSASRAQTLLGSAEVVSIVVSDTSANIASKIADLGSLGAESLEKLVRIDQKGPRRPLELSAETFSDNAAVLAKIRGSYNVNLTEVPLATEQNLTDFNSLISNARVTSIFVQASADDVTDNLALLQNTRKVKSIVPLTGPETIAFTPTEFSEAFNRKLSGFDVAVTFSGDAADFSIQSDSNGRRTVSGGGQTYKFSNTVKFFQFDDKNLFGTTGDQRLDAILMGGEQNWWYDPQRSPRSGASRSSTAQSLTATAYALDAASSRTTLKFGFLTSTDIGTYQNSALDADGFAAMTETQQDGVKRALDYISSLVNLTFELTEDLSEADLKFGTNDQGTASGAYAYQPNSAPNINIMLNNNGDPNVSTSIEAANSVMTQGSYGWATLIHEIGHALGLKHPGNYNAGGGGTPGPYLPGGDAGSKRFSIMSYRDIADGKNVSETSPDTYQPAYLNPTTFMPYDLAALQFLYGVNTTGAVNGGGALSADTPLTIENFQTTTFTNDWRNFQTLFAPSSIEDFTIDLSGVDNKNIIDLRPGAFSSINVLPATARSDLPRAVQRHQTYFGFNNVGLSYRSQVDKVLGGDGSDTYFVSGYSIEIRDSGGTNTVKLPGSASDWTASTYTEGGVDVGRRYTKGSTGQTVTLVGGDLSAWQNTWKLQYYDPGKQALVHTKVSLSA